MHSHLVAVKVINDTSEYNFPSLGDGVVVQRCEKLRFPLLNHLTCNRTGEITAELRCQRDKWSETKDIPENTLLKASRGRVQFTRDSRALLQEFKYPPCHIPQMRPIYIGILFIKYLTRQRSDTFCVVSGVYVSTQIVFKCQWNRVNIDSGCSTKTNHSLNLIQDKTHNDSQPTIICLVFRW